MSKMSELSIAVQDVLRAADDVIAAANALASLCGGADADNPVPPATKTITLEQVRAVLTEKSRDGHTAKVRALLEKHGAGKLSEIDPVEYAALLAEAEVLGNG